MDFLHFLPKRKPDSHKGDYGHVLVVAGSRGYTGAAYFTSQSAILSGSGLVTLAVPEPIYPILATKLNEVMVRSFSATQEGGFSKSALTGIQVCAEKTDVLAIGPGLSIHPQTSVLVRELLVQEKKPIMLDADGLNAFAKKTRLFHRHQSGLILTPHAGELARLVETNPQAIQSQRSYCAAQYAKEWNVVLVLKGNRTIVTSPDGKVYENSTGNPGMATGGSGDILTGIIASFVGQKIPLYSAACLGVYVHGLAGDLAAKEKGEYSLIASDILDKIPEAIKTVIRDS